MLKKRRLGGFEERRTHPRSGEGAPTELVQAANALYIRFDGREPSEMEQVGGSEAVRAHIRRLARGSSVVQPERSCKQLDPMPGAIEAEENAVELGVPAQVLANTLESAYGLDAMLARREIVVPPLEICGMEMYLYDEEGAKTNVHLSTLVGVIAKRLLACDDGQVEFTFPGLLAFACGRVLFKGIYLLEDKWSEVFQAMIGYLSQKYNLETVCCVEVIETDDIIPVDFKVTYKRKLLN